MGKQINITVDINSIVEFELSNEERIDLVNHILFACVSDKKLNIFTKDFIRGILEVETEESSRTEVINACNTLLKLL
jgi:hypothetical protein